MKKILITLIALGGNLSAKELMDMSPSDGAVPLFDGKSLDGWKTTQFDKRFWWTKNGEIQGGDLEKNVPANVWLVTEKEYENFELTFSIKLTDGGGADLLKNSGIQVRSLPIGRVVCGYQIDAGPTHPKNLINNGLGYWGNIWDEHRRGQLVIAMNQDKLMKRVKQWDWNQYKVICNGKNIRTYINGILAHDFTEKNHKIADMGVIAIQAHKGGLFLVHVKDMMIKELPASEGAVKWTDEGVIKGRLKPKRKPKVKVK